ncbi:hypothetical protein VKT23_014750 [Stygiomarasmius scandens]|uniref:Methyltransferase type 11 domain-containing protein n=1 Tax=Marasmiellus scandens TaxID=2682957 RepID=A0ABR1IZK7_9AGAR
MNNHDDLDNVNEEDRVEFEPSDPSSNDEFSDSEADSDSGSGDNDGSDSGMVDVDDDSIPSYFIERGGRLYHATNSPYPLPCDGREIQRLDAQHVLLKKVFSGNYINRDLVHEALAENGNAKIVVDFAHGTGRWTLEMGMDFPHVQFYGLEIVPITNRDYLDNVQFELNSELSQGTRFADASVTIVHARATYMAVRNYYQFIIMEAARILRPHGLFLAGEWGFPAFIGNDPHPDVNQMSLMRFFVVLRDCLLQRGITRIARDLEYFIGNSNMFHPVDPQNFWIPIGQWDPQRQELGNRMRKILRRFMSSTKPFLLQTSGLTEEQIVHLFATCNTEMVSTPRLVMVYHSVCAVRR